MVDLKAGSLVYSKSGHDKGNFFIVVEIIDDEYVLIADGKSRTIERPKRKKTKHLKIYKERLNVDELKEKSLYQNKKINDYVKAFMKKMEE